MPLSPLRAYSLSFGVMLLQKKARNLVYIHKLYTCTPRRQIMTTSLHNLTDKDGHFRRADSSFRNTIAPHSDFPPEKGRYILYANLVRPELKNSIFLSSSSIFHLPILPSSYLYFHERAFKRFLTTSLLSLLLLASYLLLTLLGSTLSSS